MFQSYLIKAIGATVLGTALLAPDAEASSARGRVVHLGTVTVANVYFVILDAAAAGTVPGCAGVTKSANRYAINATTATGKAAIATLIMAQAKGKVVNLEGTQTCADWADTESVWYVGSDS